MLICQNGRIHLVLFDDCDNISFANIMQSLSISYH